MTAMSYIVNGSVRFNNRWRAIEYANQVRTRNVKFDLYNSAFAAQDWTHEPLLGWNELCDIRCRQLEQKNRPIILMWSGGTDSYTIYNALRRNNVKISAFVTKLRDDENLVNNSVKWLQKNHNDPETEFVIQQNTDILSHTYSNEEFLINSSCYSTFSISSPDPYTDQLLRTKYNDPIILVGLEKPRLLLENNCWYSIGIDLLFEPAMPPNNVEMFYITPELPELHIKQSWLLKNWIESLNFPLTENFVNHEVHDARKFDYLSFAMACGRDGDLSCSHIQKITSRNTKIHIDLKNMSKSFITGRGEKLFNQGVLDKIPLVMNYIRSRRLVSDLERQDPYWFNQDGSPKGIITDKFYMGKLKNVD
jgi:hypothetical protein